MKTNWAAAFFTAACLLLPMQLLLASWCDTQINRINTQSIHQIRREITVYTQGEPANLVTVFVPQDVDSVYVEINGQMFDINFYRLSEVENED